MQFFYQKMLERTKIQLLDDLNPAIEKLSPSDKTLFLSRLHEHFDALIEPLYRLYHDQFDFYLHVRELVSSILQAWTERPTYLKKLDIQRAEHPQWFQDNNMMGAVCYVDLFADNLTGIEEKIPYLTELGITYLHLMPLFDSPDGENDGGYAVSSYRKVHPSLGSTKQLADLAKKLKQQGIYLVLDFINNHTSDEHDWAKAAKSGDPKFRDYYYIFPDKTLPDAFEANLREIFPEVRRGNFTWVEDVNGWVWTTFHSYQWDLNYRNPAVFTAMTKEMLFLANLGVDVLRLDAVPFTWKELGTCCENLPQAHDLIKALNACARIATPGLLFKSEAIVHPDDVTKYIHPSECQISYNPAVMALMWESLATREIKLLKESLKHRFYIHPQTSWVNYVRSHDDIGWTFSDDDARNVGINAFDHRNFLNRFYSGEFAGSFAKGVRFQFNPQNGDMRVCGTTASLAGLENALEKKDEGYLKDAMQRILLLYGLTMSLGGIPLLYLGDEIGTINDYSFSMHPEKVHDSRWVHRQKHNWLQVKELRQKQSVQSQLFNHLKQLIFLRKNTAAFGTNEIELVETGNPSVLAFLKKATDGNVFVLANFSEHTVQTSPLLVQQALYNELITGETKKGAEFTFLEPYALKWIRV